MKFQTTAPSGFETVFGRNNTTYTPVSVTGRDASDRLFVTGNGFITRSVALIVYKNGNAYLQGNVGIGISTPANKLVVYNGSTTGQYTTCGWTHSSDLRLKENISIISDIHPDVLKLQGVRFTFVNDNTKTRQMGFIAQNFKKVFPEFVVTDNDGYKSIPYGQISAVPVEAIKEQQQQIESQQREIDELKVLVNNLIVNQTTKL